MLKKILFTQLALLFLSAAAGKETEAIVVKAGDAESLLAAIEQANRQNADSTSERLFVLIPNGTYDLGERTLTAINGHNIAIVGESMEGTVIRNKPRFENEGIGKTATLKNNGTNTYVQDITLKNELDYYRVGDGGAGRAVCWQDKGNRSILKRVRMLSYQDTYYSDSETCQHYFEESEIHGTVDFICGAGDVWFSHCTIVTEKRNPDGSGYDVIAAPRTSATTWGYVFDHCTIRSNVSPFTFARGWHTRPVCTWLHTRLESPEKLRESRFDPKSLRSVDCAFLEYQTTDMAGNVISPKSNVVTFVKDELSRSAETIGTAEEAKRFTLENVFPDWKPGKIARELSEQAAKMRATYL